MAGGLEVGVAQPVSVVGDVEANVVHHADLVADLHARVVVFPEMSLTGYSMDARPIDPTDERLAPLIDVCRVANAIALVGAPTLGEDGHRRISMLRIDGVGASVAYDKMFLGGEEPAYFRPGTLPAVLSVDGWRLGLAICKDNGTAEHVAMTMALGIDAYVAGVCETEQDREVQPMRARTVLDQHRVWVVYASFAGPTGGGFEETAGRSAVRRPDHTVAVQLGRRAGQAALTTLTRVAGEGPVTSAGRQHTTSV